MLELHTRNQKRMFSVVAAGVAYFAIIFGAGFLLGMVRIFFLMPRIGETVAVIVELPVMLMLSWVIAGWLIARFDIAPRLTPRLSMGGLAFVLLMLGELGISTMGLGQTLSEHLGRYENISAILGLAGQLIFAMFPAMQLGTRC